MESGIILYFFLFSGTTQDTQDILDTHINADQGRTDVQAGGICVWNPLGVDGEQAGEALDELLALEGGQAGALGGQVHAVHVHVRPKDADLAVDAPVRLHALEELQFGTMGDAD